MFTSLRTNSMAGRLDRTTRLCLSKEMKKHLCKKKSVKSLRYKDEFLLSTNDYYLKGPS